jgi:hypothetical protein
MAFLAVGVSACATGALMVGSSAGASTKPMDDDDVLFGGGEAVPLRPKTIDDGVIRLGPARVEPLTAAQEAEAVELLTALFAVALQRRRSTPLRRAA